MKRISFLKMGGALAILAPLADSLFVQAVLNTEKECLLADDIMKDLITANDATVALLLTSLEPGNLKFSRRTGYDIAILSASYCSEGSKYYHDPLIVSRLDWLIRFLAESQSEDGTVNIANLESPPDTAFLMEILCATAHILSKDNSKELSAINSELKKIIVKAGDALSKGGVHTPNHRWVISAALSQINDLYPDKKYRDRIEDWLGEGIFIDKDGHYPERSGTYSAVEDTAFITMARLLNKPSLLEPVRKNLEMMYYYMEPDGELVSVDSRRQDQYAARNISLFYLQYRYMAIRDNNSHFAAIAKQIESMKDFREAVLDRALFYFMENSLLQKQLPAADHLPVNYEKLFTTSHLLRIRRDNTTATLFGGVDWPLITASGRSNSPNFFSYRRGNAVLKYMRLSSGFFSMGYFYSDGLRKEGSKYILYKKLEVPYYQPLPMDKRNSRGDYKLSPSIDDRFWNKMDFKNRPVSNVKTLETTITFIETNGAVELNFHIDGLKGVPVTIELCFKEGGNLSGVIASDNNNFFHEKDVAQYSFGEDRIRFGQGTLVHRSVNNLEGERYSTHFGSLRTDGMHVYLTGVTPFNHKLVFS
ncbi:hypothetical protein [Terrimonas pollutisoli]|uniref:hypothetical protein n=1 Tax=Terrimonas pollutisoli TaxID=3034147 RepID=UPI0023ED99EB|nr:hypothetical protein [Terrimonas sp. H1YJ31]